MPPNSLNLNPAVVSKAGTDHFPGSSPQGALLALSASGPVTNIDQAIKYFEKKEVGYKVLERQDNNGEIAYYFSNPKLAGGEHAGPGSQYYVFKAKDSSAVNFNVEVVAGLGFDINLEVRNKNVVRIDFPGEKISTLALTPPNQLSFRKTDTGVIAYVGSTKLTDLIESKFGAKGVTTPAHTAKIKNI